jgi:hypothetical protein
MTHNVLEELLISSEVQTARDRMEDFDAAEVAAEANPQGKQELDDLREALVEMPGAVRMLLEAIDRAGASAGEPQYDPGDLGSRFTRLVPCFVSFVPIRTHHIRESSRMTDLLASGQPPVQARREPLTTSGAG